MLFLPPAARCPRTSTFIRQFTTASVTMPVYLLGSPKSCNSFYITILDSSVLQALRLDSHSRSRCSENSWGGWFRLHTASSFSFWYALSHSSRHIALCGRASRLSRNNCYWPQCARAKSLHHLISSFLEAGCSRTAQINFLKQQLTKGQWKYFPENRWLCLFIGKATPAARSH